MNSGSFVSGHSLGPLGMRGVWTERSKGSLLRKVVVADFAKVLRKGRGRFLDDDDERDPEGTVEVNGRTVFTSHSYDLNGKQNSFIPTQSKIDITSIVYRRLGPLCFRGG